MATPDVKDDIYVGIAGFTILIWDHLDTFTTEVEYIWKGNKGISERKFIMWRPALMYLNSCNRYLTPLGFIVNLFAYLSPVWRGEVSHAQSRCRDFIRFEGAMTLIGIHIVALMMLVRINALYSTKRIVVGIVFFLFLVMFSMYAWLLTKGEPVKHNPQSGVHACTMIFPPNLSAIASSTAWLPLLYDSVVFVLTLLKAVPIVGKENGTYMMRRLLEDGLIYYAAIFSVTLVLTIMIVSAPPGLKNIAAQLELMSVTMMSRITLNLKKFAHKRLQCSILRDPGPIIFHSGSMWPTVAAGTIVYPSPAVGPEATRSPTATVYRSPPA
ncbi:hypothetical protein DFH07DRAFT_827319 [Mycena maculata]|uniref:DUF6533 domain-containing protein n=1 Tax=Mycena maculata TaxID=230809 RepID=A0AAD7IW75_9AGAR|nr:hypothetical protein DFH07DRAFT_827319 [Mycena maculata]